MDYITLISIPLISAIIGWLTNWIAVKMIFRPLKPKKLLFLQLWGLVPRRQRELAQSIAETIEQELISHKDIQEALNSPEVKEQATDLIEEQVEAFIKQKLSTVPVLGGLLGEFPTGPIKKLVLPDIQANIPELLSELATRIESRIDFRKIIQTKIEDFELQRLEEMVYKIADRELKAIEYLGGVIGFVIGLIQVAIAGW